MVETFGTLLQAHADGPQAEEIAIRYPDGSTTWRCLEADSAALARRLLARGVEVDDLIGVMLPNGVNFHTAVFAIWRCGGAPCVLPSRLPGRELSQILDLARPRVLIASEPPFEGAPIVPPRGEVPRGAPPLPPSLYAKHWKAVPSGGSTGRPKIIVDHAPAIPGDRLLQLLDMVGMPRGGVMLNPGPLYHNAPFLFTSMALVARTRVVGMTRFDPEEALRLIERERVQWVCLVPTMMQRIWALPETVRARYDLSSLKTVIHMAAACPMWLKQAWIDWLGPERILELYGGTEGPSTLIRGDEWLRKPGSVGRVSPDAVAILDEAGRPCAPGVVGEIHFAAETLERFHYLGAEPRVDAAGRLSLGDLGHVDADGYLFLADRRTDLIIRGGANVYPAEVEAALVEHPDVTDAVVIGLPDEDLGASVHAIVETASGSFESIDAFVRERLAKYKCPQSYERAAGRLRDEAGKVRRASLRDERVSWIQEGRAFGRTPGRQLQDH